MSSVKEYKCLNCKAGLSFDPTSQKWKCHYCRSEFEKAQLEKAANVQEPLEEENPELESYRCASCGAELIAEDTVAATFCIYCKNPSIIKTRFSGRFKPRYVIPFRLTKQQAQELYFGWIKKILFAPKEFKQSNDINKITGIYAPFWLYDCDVSGTIEGEGTTVRSWTSGEYRHTETSYFHVVRSGTNCYKKIPVDASTKLNDEFMHKIEPYDYKDLTDFSMPYMSGFFAEKYDVESAEAQKTMKERVDTYFEKRLRDTARGYSSLTIRNKNIGFDKCDDHYAMLPVYVLTSKYKDKELLFIINGQSGKVVGDAPISRLKQFGFFFGVFAASVLLALFGGALFV